MSAMAIVDETVWGAKADGVSALERELARLRRSSGAHAKEQGVSVARASVLNLVVLATRDVHARRAAATIDELATRHPSRAIVVVTDRDRTGTDADLEMRCRLPHPGGAQQVSYEQILIRARGNADQRLASAVIPLRTGSSSTQRISRGPTAPCRGCTRSRAPATDGTG